MKQHYQYIFKLLAISCLILFCIDQNGFGYVVQDSTLQSVDDSLNSGNVPWIRNAEIFVDYLKLLSLPSNFEKKAEGGLGFYLRNKFGANFEVGYGKITPEEAYKNSYYKVEGYYGRLGINYLYIFKPGVRLNFGLKYAESHFSDEGEFTIKSPLWNDYTGTFNRTDLKATWSEIIFGSESSWKRNLYLGFIVRFRILMTSPDFDDIELYAIPGYGKAINKSVPAVNLYIKYIFDFSGPAR